MQGSHASGILRSCSEKGPHLGNHPPPHPEFSELPDTSSHLWVTERPPFNPAYIWQGKNLCVYSQQAYVNSQDT